MSGTNDDQPPYQNIKSHEKRADDQLKKLVGTLQRQLAKEKNNKRYDRFIFIVVGIILLDVFFFTQVVDGLAALGIVFLEFLLLVILSKRMDLGSIRNQILEAIKAVRPRK